MPGILALVGGGEFGEGCDFDAELLAASGGTEVHVVPAGAAFEHPDRLVAKAAGWFESLGGRAVEVPVLTRRDALDPQHAEAVRSARFVYLAGPSPFHLKSVLKETPLWDAIVAAWQGGAVLAGSSAGAMVLADPMVDPRGGAFTVGIGLIAPLAVVPHADTWSEDKLHRTQKLAPPSTPVAGIDERTALLRRPDGRWEAAGAGRVRVWLGGRPVEDLSALP